MGCTEEWRCKRRQSDHPVMNYMKPSVARSAPTSWIPCHSPNYYRAIFNALEHRWAVNCLGEVAANGSSVRPTAKDYKAGCIGYTSSIHDNGHRCVACVSKTRYIESILSYAAARQILQQPEKDYFHNKEGGMDYRPYMPRTDVDVYFAKSLPRTSA